jgi:hypothetical protein
MAVGFSFEEAKQPLEPQGFSFDEAKQPLEPQGFSFDAAKQKLSDTEGLPFVASPEEVAITQPEPTIPTDEGFFARNYRYAKDALLSGFENIRANTKGEALAIARGSMLSYEKQYGGPGIPLAPPNVKKTLLNFKKRLKNESLQAPYAPKLHGLKQRWGMMLRF